MAYAKWMLLALLATSPVLADQTEFQGHAIEAEGVADARQVLRVRGTRYAIPGTPAQIVGKAQLCLARKDSGAGVVSVDAAAGRLAAISRVEYRDVPSNRLVKGRLTVEAGEGSFSVVLGNLGILQGVPGETADEVFSPLSLRPGSGWEPALAALIGVEQALVDCMFL